MSKKYLYRFLAVVLLLTACAPSTGGGLPSSSPLQTEGCFVWWDGSLQCLLPAQAATPASGGIIDVPDVTPAATEAFVVDTPFPVTPGMVVPTPNVTPEGFDIIQPTATFPPATPEWEGEQKIYVEDDVPMVDEPGATFGPREDAGGGWEAFFIFGSDGTSKKVVVPAGTTLDEESASSILEGAKLIIPDDFAIDYIVTRLKSDEGYEFMGREADMEQALELLSYLEQNYAGKFAYTKNSPKNPDIEPGKEIQIRTVDVELAMKAIEGSNAVLYQVATELKNAGIDPLEHNISIRIFGSSAMGLVSSGASDIDIGIHAQFNPGDNAGVIPDVVRVLSDPEVRMRIAQASGLLDTGQITGINFVVTAKMGEIFLDTMHVEIPLSTSELQTWINTPTKNPYQIDSLGG